MDENQLRPARLANVLLLVLGALVICQKPCMATDEPRLRAGAAAIPITPFGKNPDWDGPVTASGVWGETFTDTNNNHRWDPGEPFTDDPANTALTALSKEKYDGIYLAGFGDNRMAIGKHDDLWARALVLDYGKTRIAIVALDFIGYYSHGGFYGADAVRKILDPSLGVTDILIASTHNHEGPDTVGIWGANPVSDGKYPRYLQFVDREIAKAIQQAVKSLTPVRLKLGTTNPQLSPALAGMQGRTWGRPPRFFDEEMRVMQFSASEGADKGKVISTLINWNVHPESMEDKNTILTSDFPGATRDTVEAKYGGTAIYISGDIGAVEIIGDNESRGRTTFDGQNFPFVPKHEAESYTFARTEAIGRDIAKAVFDALRRGEWSKATTLALKKAELRVPMDNVGYKFLLDRGILTTIPMNGNAPEVVTTIYAIELGDAQILTAPGELFPEVFYGVAKFRRTDCPAEDSKRPAEPPVREFMTAKYKFIFGLTPDELGYIVPGYDFHSPAFSPEKGFTEAPDACAATGVPTHYHETNSASSQMAPAYACAAVKLLTGKPLAQSPCKELEGAVAAH